MTRKEQIEELAKEFERADTACYGWTSKQFDIWWDKDDRNKNHKNQRAKAKLAVEFLEKARRELNQKA